jgi:hypothetical protein
MPGPDPQVRENWQNGQNAAGVSVKPVSSGLRLPDSSRYLT